MSLREVESSDEIKKIFEIHKSFKSPEEELIFLLEKYLDGCRLSSATLFGVRRHFKKEVLYLISVDLSFIEKLEYLKHLIRDSTFNDNSDLLVLFSAFYYLNPHVKLLPNVREKVRKNYLSKGQINDMLEALNSHSHDKPQ